MTLGDFASRTRKALEQLYPPQEAQAVVLRLVEDFYKIPSYKVFAQPDIELSGDAPAEAVEQLKNGRPLQYVLGYAEFCGHRIRVREGCLIPRPETEELVARIIDDCSSAELGEEPFNILDMCTGSGCIAWSLAAALPFAMVYGCDISQEALAIACKQRIKVPGTHPVLFQADILSAPPAGLPQFDVIVSNPPYILESERASMHRNVVEYEPESALFVPDDDPLKFYRAIAQWAGRLLRPGGRIYLEVNERQAEKTAALFPGAVVADDINAKHRFVVSIPREIRDKGPVQSGC